MILLDTHALVWLAEGNRALGRAARRKLDAALHGSRVALASISYWEIAMLVQKGRLSLSIQPAAFRLRVIESGVEEIPLDGATAIHAATLESFHGDPADRIIAASALAHDAILCTADAAILDWGGKLRTLDARR
jgi:PIN domain nuclease of toxin-antitoxin system